MKTVGTLMLAIGLSLGAIQGGAQAQTNDTVESLLPGTNAPPDSSPGFTSISVAPLLTEDHPAPPQTIIDPSESLRAATALQQTKPAGQFSKTTRRFFERLNPFAPVETPAPVARDTRISPHAWTTVAGWHPGVSAFADPETHEPELDLFNLPVGP